MFTNVMVGASDLEKSKQFHDAGVANGGTTCEDPPDVRSGGFGDLYIRYLRDPDGNKVRALHRVKKAGCASTAAARFGTRQ